MAINDAEFSTNQRKSLRRYGLNERQVAALENILPALGLITLPHKAMDAAQAEIDAGQYVHLPHYITIPVTEGKAPGGANPDAIELIFRELFRVGVNPAIGEEPGMSPFPRWESDLVRRHRGTRPQVAVNETLLTVRSDSDSAFFKIAEICYQAAHIRAKPERAIRSWLSRERQRPDGLEWEVVDAGGVEQQSAIKTEALRMLNVRKGRPEDYDPASEMFMRLRRQWVLDNPDMPKNQRREMAAGIPGLEHISLPSKKAARPKAVKKAARRKPKAWRD